MLELRVRRRNEIRLHRVRLLNGIKLSYCIHGAGLLGDCIKAFQHAWAASRKWNSQIGLYPSSVGHDGLGAGFWQEGVVREIMVLFDFNDAVELIIPKELPRSLPFNYGKYMRVPMLDPFLDESPVEYQLVKHTWTPGRYNRMCYQFYGRSCWWRQNFLRHEAIRLHSSFRHLDRVKLGMPMTIAQSVEVMRNSDFFVGIDSGMTHLARCVGVPTFVNPQKVPMDWFHRWHPPGSPSYTIFRTLDELHQQLKERLPWVLPTV